MVSTQYLHFWGKGKPQNFTSVIEAKIQKVCPGWRFLHEIAFHYIISVMNKFGFIIINIDDIGEISYMQLLSSSQNPVDFPRITLQPWEQSQPQQGPGRPDSTWIKAKTKTQIKNVNLIDIFLFTKRG